MQEKITALNQLLMHVHPDELQQLFGLTAEEAVGIVSQFALLERYPIELYHLFSLNQRPDYPIPPQTTQNLIGLGLLLEDGSMSPVTRHIMETALPTCL